MTLFIFDEHKNFHSENTQLRIGNALYENVFLIVDRNDFDNKISALKSEQQFILICHVFHAASEENIKHRGYHKFKGSGIEDDYGVTPIFVSSGDSGEVMKTIYDIEKDVAPVYSYTKIRENIKSNAIKIYTKADLLNSQSNSKGFDFGIITALYNDEFEEVEKLFDWDSNGDTETTRFRFGKLKGVPTIKIVASVQSETGMIDAGILATHMLEKYKPKYLLMPGVCGGIPDLPLGSIIIASGVFTFQKGKVSDYKDDKGKKVIKYFDNNKKQIDLSNIFDDKGRQLKIFVEKFEIENDLIRIDPLVKTKMEPHIKRIQDKINEPYKLKGQEIKIVFEKLACSTMVINKEDYFDERIKPSDRKTAGVEMESYGIARACHLANDGRTKFIIFKGVMDNMKDKGDGAKSLAAYTSAQFLRHLIADNILF